MKKGNVGCGSLRVLELRVKQGGIDFLGLELRVAEGGRNDFVGSSQLISNAY